MKTRRALQKIVGILSLLVVLCMLAAAISVALSLIFNMPAITSIFDSLKNGFNTIASLIGLTGLSFLVPLIAYLLPTILLLLAGIIVFLPDKGKHAKYYAAVIFALIGIAILTLFTGIFAADLVSGESTHLWYIAPFGWTATDTIIRYVAVGLLAIFLLFISLALRRKKHKKQDATTEDEDAATESQENAETNETATCPCCEEHATEHATETTQTTQATQTTATEHEPTYTHTHEARATETANRTYRKEEPTDPAITEKINKARMFYEMGVITYEEYVKITNKNENEQALLCKRACFFNFLVDDIYPPPHGILWRSWIYSFDVRRVKACSYSHGRQVA